MKRLFLLVWVVCTGLRTLAAEPDLYRLPSRSWMWGVGKARQVDTYLSPLRYTGLQVNLLQESRRALAWRDDRGTFRSTLQANVSATNAWSGTDYWNVDVHYDATWQYRFSPTFLPGLQLQLGGGLGATLGGLYARHRGNNPAQAHAQLRLLASATASYDFNIRRQRFMLRYQADLPLMGLMFSPAYGQSYYEIFAKGDYDHNLVFFHPFAAPSLRQQFSLDIPLKAAGRHRLRLGYLSDIRQAKPNHLRQNLTSRSFVLGFVKYLRK